MKKSGKNIFIITALVLSMNPLNAKVNHTHELDTLHIIAKHEHNHSCAAKVELEKKGIQRGARKRLWMLVQTKKIDASWLEAPIVSTDKKQFGDKVEWVVNYRNLNIQNKDKQNIYIFVDFYGHVLASNYTGK